MIRLDRVGLTTVQDAGRPGFAHLGVPLSGAADRGAYQLANRLAGNSPGAAVLETSGGLIATALSDVTIMLTGADSEASREGRPMPRCRATALQKGETIRVDRMRNGNRAYLGISGGIVGIENNASAESLLGSLSHDTLSGLVPVSLHDGVVLRIGTQITTPSSLDLAIDYDLHQPLKMTEGPHRELFSTQTIHRLVSTPWSVSPSSNRMGIRLIASQHAPEVAGNEIPPATQGNGTSLGELQSFPLVRGAVQVTSSEELVVMLADHPTTGGYPVIGVV
ncbi:MAG: biotin-dependent carboxyltransferase family protein, partial [Actinomycetota bacterium]